ncbi:MAG: ABC transporter permease [Lachnospiraceae bacterium]|jgi:teichoic acid transport system permease protein
MSKKKTIVIVLTVLLMACINVFIMVHRTPVEENVNIYMTVEGETAFDYQLYYAKDTQFVESDSVRAEYNTPGKEQALLFAVRGNSQYIRLNTEAMKTLPEAPQITDVYAEYDGQTWPVENFELYKETQIPAQDFMPVIQEAQHKKAQGKNIFLCVILDLVFLALLGTLNRWKTLPAELYRERKLILKLAKNDFKTKYAGSYLGIVWAFIQPIITVLVYWFVFQVGLRSGAVGRVPFVLWLVAGLVPWFFFSDSLGMGTNALLEYNYLVKKVVFKISILPIVKIISALFVHLFFIAFTIILYMCYGYTPDLYTLQVFYYTFCVFVFTLGLCYATCAIVAFFRDLTQIIGIILQVGVWMTPIMWNFNQVNLPSFLQTIFKLNPMYYIVFGYREALIDKVWFWDNMDMTIYFWVLTACVFALGALIFKRLKVHFADIL